MSDLRFFRSALVGSIIFSFAFLSTPTANAHSELVLANPAADSKLMNLPSKVEVTFGEDLMVMGNAHTNVLQVIDSSGKQIDDGDSKTTGATLTVGVTTQTVTGTFLVKWRVVSADGHPGEGSYSFFVEGTIPVVSSAPVDPVASHVSTQKSFWTRNSEKILLALGGLIFIGIWAEFDRRRKILDHH